MAVTCKDIANMGDAQVEREEAEYRRHHPLFNIAKTTDDPKLEALKKKLKVRYRFPD